MINRTLKTFAQHRAYIMRHGIVCFCRLFLYTHSHIQFNPLHGRWYSPISPTFTLYPQTSTKQTICLFFFFFLFFFSKSIHTQILTCFFKPTLRNMTVCYFLSTFFFFCFFVFFFMFFFFLHQGQIMYIEMLYATEKSSGTLTWNKKNGKW